MNVTRRTLARLAAAAAVARTVSPQAAQTPQADGDADLVAARTELRNYYRQLEMVRLPAGTEPAFRFKA